MKNLLFAYSGENKVYTKLAECVPNKKIYFNQLILKCKGSPPAELVQLRQLIFDGLSLGLTWDEIKKQVEYKKYKNALDYFLPSGFCPIHHNDESLTNYNGCCQIDIDFKFEGGDKKAIEIKEQLQKINYIAFAAISASGHGVKALALTDNTHKDKNVHRAACEQVIKDLSIRLNIDRKYFDNLSLSQPCFIPYDKDIYFRFSPTKFKVNKAKIQENKNLAACSDFLQNSNNATGTAWEVCNKFAASKGFKAGAGANHLYLSFFSICANLLGIKQRDVENYAASIGINVDSNCIEYPYKTYQNNFGRWADILLFQSDRKIIEGKAGQRLTEILKTNQDFDFNTRIIAPTGTGKTYWALHVQGRKIFVVPTVALVDNICNDENYQKFNPLPVHDNARNLSQVRNSDCIVTTYASFPNVALALRGQEKEYRIFIDEYHNFSSSTSQSFRLLDLERVLRIAPRFNSNTLLSGTELFNAHPAINDLPIIQVRIPKRKVNFKFVNAVNGIKALADLMQKSIAAGRFPFVLFNNKGEQLASLKALLHDLTISYINADNKQDADFIQIVREGIISQLVQGIVATTVMSEGNNINSKYDVDCYIFGMFHPSEIEQFINRFRNPKSVQGCIIRSDKRVDTPNYFRSTSYAAWLNKACTNWCNELNIKSEISEDLIIREFIGRSHIQRLPIRKNDLGNFETDNLQLSNFVFEREKVACYQFDERMKAELAKYNIIVSESVAFEMMLKPLEQVRSRNKRKEYKEQLHEQYTAGIETLKKQFRTYNFAANEVSKRKDTAPKGAKLAYQNYVTLNDKIVSCFGVEPNKDFVFDKLQTVGTSKAAFSRLLKQINLFALYSNKEYMKSNRKFAIVLKKIFATFQDGEVLTADQIKNKIVECLSIDSSFDLSVFDQRKNSKVMNILKLFFDTQKSSIRTTENGGKPQSGHKIVCLILGGLIRKTAKIRHTNKAEKQAIKDLQTLIK